MWVVFLLSAVGFAIGALILFSIGWLVIHKIEMHINRQDDDYENEKKLLAEREYKIKSLKETIENAQKELKKLENL